MTQRAVSPPDTPPLDDAVTRLRVALRLACAGGVADELAGRVRAEDELAGSGRALRVARWRLGLDRRLRLLPWRREGGDDTLLGPSSAVRPDDAVALIARVGLGLDVFATADLLQTTPEHVARSLFGGRRALDRPIGEACDRFAEAIGEYDDPSADPDERVALVTHMRFCQSCRQAVDRSRKVDVWLHGELDRIAVGLGTAPPVRDRTTRLRPELLVPAVIAAIVATLFLGSLALFDWLTSPPHVPVSALSAPVPETELSGWLVTSAQGGRVQAENLRTGETRVLAEADDNGTQWPLMSPDHSRLALIRQAPTSTSEPSFHTEIYDLDGRLIGTHDWSGDDEEAGRWPFGWLDNETIFAVEWPKQAPGETSETYRARMTAESVLLGVDVTSGAIRELARGDIGYAVASPDGSMVAVVGGTDSQYQRSTVALRPMTAGVLGEPVWTNDTGVISLLWSPSSDTLYASITASGTEQPTVVAVDRAGAVTTLVQPLELGEMALPASVSPDGRTVIVAAGDATGLGVNYWRIDRASGERIELAGSEADGWSLRPVWSPDGATLLLPVREPFYLASGSAGLPYPGGDSGVALVGYDASWQRRLIGGWLDTSQELLAWLPEERFPAAEPVRIGDSPTITAPEPLGQIRSALRTSPDSAASPDGRFVILYDGDANIPVIWDRQTREGRQVSGDSSELAWLPGGRAVFGVVPFADAANRLVGFSATSDDIVTAVDFQRFDPVGLGENTQAHYERPLVSPDGTTMSFFVVDEARGEAALWLASWGHDPRQVARWSVPAEAIPSRPFAASWIDDQTLLLARADGWDRGMPRRAALVRVAIDGDETRVEELAGIDGRGGDRGVVVQEMTVSPDGTQLAYRLRHYRAFAADREVMDTVRVVALTDVTSPIELSSGGASAGVSWAPDSRWLATSTGGRIIVASSDGRTIRDVAEDLPGAAHPVWVGNEVWFSVPDQDHAMWRVVVRE